MALDDAGLESDIADIGNNHPATHSAAAKAWAEAMESYALNIVPSSTDVEAAATTLESELASAMSQGADATAELDTAFDNFAATIAAGMDGYIATPPPESVGFATAFAPPHPETVAEAAENVSSVIDTWMKTGTAYPEDGDPEEDTVPWS